jgi:hypothetical protein
MAIPNCAWADWSALYRAVTCASPIMRLGFVPFGSNFRAAFLTSATRSSSSRPNALDQHEQVGRLAHLREVCSSNSNRCHWQSMLAERHLGSTKLASSEEYVDPNRSTGSDSIRHAAARASGRLASILALDGAGLPGPESPWPVCDQFRSRREIAHGRRKGPAGSQTRHTTDRCHALHHRGGGTFSRLGHCGPSFVEGTASHLSPNSPGQGLFFSLMCAPQRSDRLRPGPTGPFYEIDPVVDVETLALPKPVRPRATAPNVSGRRR